MRSDTATLDLMSDTEANDSTTDVEPPEGEMQIPQDRVSLLRMPDGTTVPYVPPTLARKKQNERLAEAMGRISDMELVTEFYVEQIQNLMAENAQLRQVIEAYKTATATASAEQTIADAEQAVANGDASMKQKPARATRATKRTGGNKG